MSNENKTPIGAVIALALIKMISKLKCKLTCCCQSSCTSKPDTGEELEVPELSDVHQITIV